jgi:U3 small nucleolar RNA-associated protein 7
MSSNNNNSTNIDKKINDQIKRNQRITKVITVESKRNLRYLEQENEGYLLPENEREKTLKISQDYLKENLPKYNNDNVFDLNLQSGAYSIDYSRNGTHLLLAGEKGHIAMMDWREKNLECEIQVGEKIRTACFLHNESMFAVAQRKKIYIYDRQGIELHNLDYHPYPKYLQYLPFHFLLVSGLKNK